MFTCNTPVFKSHVTVPETFYFPIFWFVKRRLTVPSQCIQRAFSMRSSFTVLCSAFTISLHSLFTKCSPFAHHVFTYRSQIVHRSFSIQFSLSFRTLCAFSIRSPFPHHPSGKEDHFSNCDIIILHVIIIILHANIIILHVDIICLACRGRNLFTQDFFFINHNAMFYTDALEILYYILIL